jgi:hypothetical protein
MSLLSRIVPDFLVHELGLDDWCVRVEGRVKPRVEYLQTSHNRFCYPWPFSEL